MLIKIAIDLTIFSFTADVVDPQSVIEDVDLMAELVYVIRAYIIRVYNAVCAWKNKGRKNHLRKEIVVGRH